MSSQAIVDDPNDSIEDEIAKVDIPPCTVVSLFPLAISEKKPGLYPGYFDIKAAKKDDIEVLVVKSSVHFAYLDSDRGSLSVENHSAKVAKAIVLDFINASIMHSLEAHPGMFVVQGAFTKEEVKLKFPEKIIRQRARQEEWFKALVQAADDEWTRTRQHRSIMDIQRLAAEHLGLKREWNIIINPEDAIKCPGCQSMVNSQQVVCHVCRAVLNVIEWRKMLFADQAAPIVNTIPAK